MATAVATEPSVEREQRVTVLELFFDLVFVFAITQVTGLLAADPSWTGLGHALLMLAALWWAWAAYAWLTNTVNPEEGAVRLAMFAAMAAMLIAALAVPRAFAGKGALFGGAYFVARAFHVALYALAARGDPALWRAVALMTPTALGGPALILAAGIAGGDVEAPLFGAALAADYLGVLRGRAQGWRVSPGHFAERHGLIVIVALGESIVAIGVGAARTSLDLGVVVAALLGVAVAACLWWAYFDVVAIVAERKLREKEGPARAAQARDSYSYLHLPMVAGIVLFAFGVKSVIVHVGSHLQAVPAAALAGGLALYLLAHIAFRLRNVGTLNRQRLVAAAALAALAPAATHVPGLTALALAAAICTGLIAYEAIHFAEARRRVRAPG